MAIVDQRNPASSFFFSMNAAHQWTAKRSNDHHELVKKGKEGNPMEGKTGKLKNLFELAVSKVRKQPKPMLCPSAPVSSSGPSKIKPAFSFKQFGFIGSASSRGARVSWMFDSGIRLPGTEDRIVVYFTSLRGVRRTHEDCYAVRMILRGHRVEVDERDVSMDMGFRQELESVMGKSANLPKVFVRGTYVGGAEEIKQLNETGDLRKLLKGIPLRDKFVCEGCGDARFMLCPNCDGSRKVFCEEEDEVRRCGECNENGLIRCPVCCR